MQIACKRESSRVNETKYPQTKSISTSSIYHRLKFNEFILDILDLAAAEMLLATSRAVAWNDTRETLGAAPG